MKFCIISNVPLGTSNGIGTYIKNLCNLFRIPDEHVYNVFALTNSDIEYINKTFNFVNLHIGLLESRTAEGLKIQKLKKIKLKKIATIHNVPDEEVRLFEECMTTYFPTRKYPIDTIIGRDYEKFFLKLVDGLIFNTKSDYKIFSKFYSININSKILPPSVQYILDNSTETGIVKSNNMLYLGRVDYRKGLICSLNSMEFLPRFNLDVIGGINAKHSYNKVVLGTFLKKLSNIRYKGKLKKSEVVKSEKYFIFLGNSLYEPFGFSHMECLFNDIVPIIGKNTGTHEVFGDTYPYAIEDSVPELIKTVNIIENTPTDQLQSILDKAKNNIKTYTDKFYKDNFLAFCKEILNK